MRTLPAVACTFAETFAEATASEEATAHTFGVGGLRTCKELRNSDLGDFGLRTLSSVAFFENRSFSIGFGEGGLLIIKDESHKLSEAKSRFSGDKSLAIDL